MGAENTTSAASEPVSLRDLVMDALALHVLRIFDRNVTHRRTSGIDEKLKKCLRLSRCEYSPEDKALFKEKGAPEIFMPIADMKRRAAMAMFVETFSTPGDKSWTLSPTPVSDIPAEIRAKAIERTRQDYFEYASKSGKVPSAQHAVQYLQDRMGEMMNEESEWAKERALRMERKIHDLMIEGGWLGVFGQYSGHLCTYGTCVIEGPIPQLKMKKRYVKHGGVTRCEMVEEIALSYGVVSPWDCYPSKGARTVDQGDFCMKVRYVPADFLLFSKMSGPEWRRDNVNDILSRHESGGVFVDVVGENERRRMEGSESDLNDQCVIEGVKYYGSLRGNQLLDLGLLHDTSGNVIEDRNYYESCVIVVDNMVVYCKITDPEIGRPLSKGMFYSVPDSWWGDSILEKCESTQRLCNAAVRDLVVNMAQSSGPQTVIKDISRLHPSCSPSQSPWKVWLFQNSVMGQGDNPLHVFQPDSNIRELLLVFDFGMKQADNDTGIPAYTYGAAMAGGAGRTSSGLAMMLENVNRGIKAVVTSTDADVVRSVVTKTFDWLMLYSEDESIKGDVEVNPSGVMSLVLRENGSVRRRAFLQLLANPLIAQAVLPSGIAAIMREEARSLDVNPDDVIPSREKLKEMDEIAQFQRQLELREQMANTQAAGQQAMPEGGQPPQGQPAGMQSDPRQSAMRGAMRVGSQGNGGGEQ